MARQQYAVRKHRAPAPMCARATSIAVNDATTPVHYIKIQNVITTKTSILYFTGKRAFRPAVRCEMFSRAVS